MIDCHKEEGREIIIQAASKIHCTKLGACSSGQIWICKLFIYKIQAVKAEKRIIHNLCTIWWIPV